MKKPEQSSTSALKPEFFSEKTRPKLQSSLTLSVSSSHQPCPLSIKAPNSTKARVEELSLMSLSSNPIQRSRTARGSPFHSASPSMDPSSIKSSIKENGFIRAYAAGTDSGPVRDYNEDRVSIILNINKPVDRQSETWPKCSFFAVYDGHGGSACADFLRDNLHQFITRSLAFPYNPEQAIFEGFALAEKTFQDYAKSLSPPETSGSCAIVLLVVDQLCYVANLGDSRAIMSGEKGKKVYSLSKDHKPNDSNEKSRIEAAGGRVYQTTLQVADETLLGPSRILPGRLSVSRSIGDIEAKCLEFGGNPNVLISVPEVKTFKIHPEYDFILLASDGIFDKLSNREAVTKVTEKLKEQPVADLHRQSELGVEAVMNAALVKKTKDNITVVMIALDGLLNKANHFVGQKP